MKEFQSIENVYLQPIPEFEIHRKRDLYAMTYPQLLEVAAKLGHEIHDDISFRRPDHELTREIIEEED